MPGMSGVRKASGWWYVAWAILWSPFVVRAFSIAHPQMPGEDPGVHFVRETVRFATALVVGAFFAGAVVFGVKWTVSKLSFARNEDSHPLFISPESLRGHRVADMTDEQLGLWIKTCEAIERWVTTPEARQEWSAGRAEAEAEVAHTFPD